MEMESKIIPEEILRLYMVGESERLFSEMKNGDIGKHLYLVRAMVRIVRYERDKDWGKYEAVYENSGFIVSNFIRWKWFFRHLQAKEQLKTPKQLVQIHCISYVHPDREKTLLRVLRNKLTAAKRDRTKAQLKIESGKREVESKSLFGFEGDPNYSRALEYLSKKTELIDEIEAEILQLETILNPLTT